MTKQEFLAMSIFTGLKYIDDNKKIVDLHCIDNGISLVNFGWGDAKNIDEVFPILHPLSDLTKEIEHKGEKFVPMIELSKLAGFEPQQLDPIDEIVTICNNYSISFGYEKGSFFAGRINFKENDWIEDITVKNQLQLFSKLIEWHFDIADLISKGEAIDVNTLPENPYK